MFGSLSRREWFAGLCAGVYSLLHPSAEAPPEAPAPLPPPSPDPPLITTTTYDAAQPWGGESFGAWTTCVYDARGRPTATIDTPPRDAAPSDLG
jgi:hypothetical protein